MLGSLARKLRAFGFDSSYYRHGTDAGILAACRRQGRVLLTSDRQLAASAGKRGLSAILVVGQSDRARLSSMVRRAHSMGLELRRSEPRCSLCNSMLARVTAAEAREQVPNSVALRHRVFYRCSHCGQLYWKGGHWKKLRSLETLLGSGS